MSLLHTKAADIYLILIMNNLFENELTGM